MKATSSLIMTLLISSYAMAGQFVYPAEGQSSDQQKQDEAACYSWAVDQSDYDPAKPPAAPSSAAQPTKRASPSGARIKGAARGALIGEIADGDTGDAALAGAVLGGSSERRGHRRSQKQAQATAQKQRAAALEKLESSEINFNKAQAACLEGRGYTVK